MLDINYIKENPQEVIDRLAMKGKDAQEDIAKILELDGKDGTICVIGEYELSTFKAPIVAVVSP